MSPLVDGARPLPAPAPSRAPSYVSDVQVADPAVMAAADETAWTIVLDRIELDVMRGERNLARGLEFRTDLWDAPDDDLGPVPASLHERALSIHRRQLVLLEQMSERLHYTLRQQAVAEAVSRATQAGPVYLDVSV